MNVNVNNLSGLAGGICIDSTDGATAGDFNAVQFLSEGTLSNVQGNVSGLVGKTFTAGTILYGRYKSITVASGDVVLYNHG